MVVADEKAGPVIGVIVEAARAGAVGDGKVRSTPVDEVVRIRAGERGLAAV